ncbi:MULTISPECIES: alanine racemase [unclassified Microbacterium]|uniref:alanine racemase n=1 Tax=unclassified Microbacterium TaxID=2609290 RepID=UPI0034264D87
MCETSSSSRPRALISRSALATAAAAAVAAGGTVADLRRDAWGHGIRAVARAAIVAGAGAVRVDSAEQVEALAQDGIVAVTTGEPDIDPRLLYGLAGSSDAAPVLRLAGRVLSTKPLKTGDAVSYGYTFRAEAPTTVALVTGGYAQGILRALGNRAEVEIDGRLRPIVGRVAMDVCVVDLQDAATTAVGTEVTYFGGQGPAARALTRWSEVTGLGDAELLAVAAAHADRGWEA